MDESRIKLLELYFFIYELSALVSLGKQSPP